MKGPLATAIIVVALLLALWTLGQVLLDRPPGLSLLAGSVVLEVLLAGFAVSGIAAMVGTGREFARAEFVGYLLGGLVIPPAAAVWGWAERSRSGTAVLAVAFLITPVMVVRVQQVWAGPVG